MKTEVMNEPILRSSKFSLHNRAKSFVYAGRGILYFFRTQHNSWLQLCAAFLALLLALFLKIQVSEWSWIIFSIGFVFSAEMMNTAIEYLADVASPGHNEKVGRLKDLAAGAVLLSSLTALVIGILIFTPKIILLLGSIRS